MEDKNVSLPVSTGQYLILSALTKRPYIDESRQAYLFADKTAASEFIKNQRHGKTVCVDLSREKLKTICSRCYAAGAEYIVISESGGRKIRGLSERHLDKNYYNCRLSADLSLLQHTKKMKYVSDLAECEYIVPIKITNGEEVSIVYATVSRGSGEHYLYLAFTDLQEYGRWEKEVGPGWKPLAVDIDGVKRIGRKHGFMINPMGGRFILSMDILKKLPSEDDEEDD